MLPDEKRKKLISKSERLDKIDLVLHQHNYPVYDIVSSMQELVSLVSNAIIIKEATGKKEMKSLHITTN